MGSDQKRVFLAVVLSGIVLVVWQTFFAPKPVIGPKVEQYKNRVVEENKNVQGFQELEAPQATANNENEGEKSQIKVQNITLNKDGHSFSFDNKLALKNSTNTNSIIDFNSIVGNEGPFKIQILTNKGPRELLFNWAPNSDSSKLTGEDSAHEIKATIELSDRGRLNIYLTSPNAYRYRLIFKSSKKELDNQQARKYLVYSKDVDRYYVGDAENGEGRIKWFGLDFNFHMLTFIFQNKQMSKFYTNESGYLILDTINPQNNISGGLIFTKKDYDHLLSFGDNLELSVDFGFFYVLAVPIMRGLQFFYKYIPNYGVAIILLTLLIRMITFPLQYKSFKSMKKMQKVQPELAKIKEKFKDDPQRMQKETMELFKRAGANPLGGCLPLILQMPIFFAFYQVLYESVELLGAPFFGWISDLSQKDPYFVLPVLMSLSIFLQQKFQPSTTADPTQKKIMMLMPFFFGFIMINVSSGLVLYIFVSTLFGMIQQYFVYRTTD